MEDKDTTEEETVEADAVEDSDAAEDPPAELGDKGKKALDEMKAKWRAERDKRKELEAKLNKESDGKEVDKQTSIDAKQLVAKANERVLKAEIKAAAAGKLTDPADANKFLDLSRFEVDDDGNVDAEEVAEAIDALVKSKPYLAAQRGGFQGSADGGARKGKSRPTQLTRDDLQGLTPEQIVAAKAEGRLEDAMRQKSK